MCGGMKLKVHTKAQRKGCEELADRKTIPGAFMRQEGPSTTPERYMVCLAKIRKHCKSQVHLIPPGYKVPRTI